MFLPPPRRPKTVLKYSMVISDGGNFLLLLFLEKTVSGRALVSGHLSFRTLSLLIELSQAVHDRLHPPHDTNRNYVNTKKEPVHLMGGNRCDNFEASVWG